MEIECINLSGNDSLNKKVFNLRILISQMNQSKSKFEKLKRELRKIQNEKVKEALHSTNNTFEIVHLANIIFSQEMEQLETKRLRENNRQLEEAKQVGYACEGVA